MKKLLVAAAFAAVAASPAFAATHHRAMDSATQAYGYAMPNSDVVVTGGQVIGQDPDTFIRGQLLREGDQTQLNGE